MCGRCSPTRKKRLRIIFLVIPQMNVEDVELCRDSAEDNVICLLTAATFWLRSRQIHRTSLADDGDEYTLALCSLVIPRPAWSALIQPHISSIRSYFSQTEQKNLPVTRRRSLRGKSIHPSIIFHSHSHVSFLYYWIFNAVLLVPIVFYQGV